MSSRWTAVLCARAQQSRAAPLPTRPRVVGKVQQVINPSISECVLGTFMRGVRWFASLFLETKPTQLFRSSHGAHGVASEEGSHDENSPRRKKNFPQTGRPRGKMGAVSRLTGRHRRLPLGHTNANFRKYRALFSDGGTACAISKHVRLVTMCKRTHCTMCRG